MSSLCYIKKAKYGKKCILWSHSYADSKNKEGALTVATRGWEVAREDGKRWIGTRLTLREIRSSRVLLHNRVKIDNANLLYAFLSDNYTIQLLCVFTAKKCKVLEKIKIFPLDITHAYI